MSLEVALEALTEDARRWRGVSDALGQAGSATTGLTLQQSQFSFVGGEVALVYERVRSHLEKLLAEGTTTASDCADVLDEVREAYEGTDLGARARLAGTWDWI